MTDFNPNRIIFLTAELSPKPLQARELWLLEQALAQAVLSPQAEVLCLTLGDSGSAITLPIFEMMYHHVAQGEVRSQPWVLSLCMLCNTGNVFSPVVNGKTLHFAARAIHDGMMMLVDDETESCWNHITGECQHGPQRGQQLTLLSDARQMNAAQALEQYPQALLIKADLSPKRHAVATEHAAFRQNPASHPHYLEMALTTMGEVDPRLPRLEIGLGVWTEKTQRFYSFSRLSAQDNVIVDELDGQPLVIYIDPETSVPCAVYLKAQAGHWEDDTLRLQGGYEIQRGVVYNPQRVRMTVKHPLQLFMRWFGFAFTFPGCQVYGAG
jgi:hypothetical protein